MTKEKDMDVFSTPKETSTQANEKPTNSTDKEHTPMIMAVSTQEPELMAFMKDVVKKQLEMARCMKGNT